MMSAVLTLVVSLYYGGEAVSHQWTDIPIDNMKECQEMAKKLTTNTIVDDQEEWSGAKYVTIAFCNED